MLKISSPARVFLLGVGVPGRGTARSGRARQQQQCRSSTQEQQSSRRRAESTGQPPRVLSGPRLKSMREEQCGRASLVLPWAEPVIPLATAARSSGGNARRAGGRQQMCSRGARDDAAAQRAQGRRRRMVGKGQQEEEIQQLRWFARISNI